MSKEIYFFLTDTVELYCAIILCAHLVFIHHSYQEARVAKSSCWTICAGAAPWVWARLCWSSWKVDMILFYHMIYAWSFLPDEDEQGHVNII